MLDIIVNILTALAAVSLPVMYLAERKCGLPKKMKRVHGILFAVGVVSLVTVCVLFKWKVTSAAGDVRLWAEDFFFSYFTPAVVSTAVITALLSSAAAIRHPMKRTRMTIAVLLPIVMILLTLFAASLADGGYFAVDFYIRALAPGLGFLAHTVPLCERRKKSD